MTINRFFIAVLLIFTTTLTNAQESAIKKIIEMHHSDNQCMRHLDILSNRFGGRMAGSDAYNNAVEWAAREFKKWGYEVTIEEAGSVPVGYNRGPWSGKLLAENGMSLNFTTPSWTSGTKGLQRGHVVIEPKTRDQFNRMKGQLKGAWVLISGKNTGWAIDWSERADSIRTSIIAYNDSIGKINNEIRANNRRNKTNDTLLVLRDEPALFYKEMREAGILGVIQASTVPIRTLYDRKVVKDTTMTFDALPTTCDIKLDEHQYEIIHQMALERRSFMLEFDIRNFFKLGPVKYHSVVATMKGTQKPDEYVMVSGHLDALDIATGGVDCGNGVSVTMEAARMIALSGAKPKRSIQFVLFAAEELGLLGAFAYTKTHPERLSKISNLFNRDGGPLATVGVTVPPVVYDDFVKICEPVKQIDPKYPFAVTKGEPYVKPTQAGGQDGTVFAMQGVPTVAFNQEDFKGYNFDYNEIWHTDRDLYNKAIPEYQNFSATVTAIVALGVANLKESLNRKGFFKE